MNNLKNKFYDIEEDTKIILKVLKGYIKNNNNNNQIKNICEMGVGSGFVIFELSKFIQENLNKKKINFYGFDINKFAVKNTKNLFETYYKKNQNSNSNFLVSNLFSKIKKNQKFDLIFFNTPYLPCEENENYKDLKLIDKAIYGGENGNEITIKFLDEIFTRNLLEEKGVIFILISSLSNPKSIEKKIFKNDFHFKIISKKKEFFEELLVYKIYK